MDSTILPGRRKTLVISTTPCLSCQATGLKLDAGDPVRAAKEYPLADLLLRLSRAQN